MFRNINEQYEQQWMRNSFFDNLEITIDNFIKSESHVLEFFLFLQIKSYRTARNACFVLAFCQIIWVENSYLLKNLSVIRYLFQGLLYFSAKNDDRQNIYKLNTIQQNYLGKIFQVQPTKTQTFKNSIQLHINQTMKALCSFSQIIELSCDLHLATIQL